MYINGTVLFFIVAGMVIYFYLKKQENNKKVSERYNYLVSKNEKKITVNNGYAEKINTLSTMVSDLINLGIVKLLADSDKERWNLVADEKYTGNDSLDKWIEESEEKNIVEARNIKSLHSAVLRKLDEVVEYYNEQIEESLIDGSEKNVEDNIFDLLGAYLHVESFYQKVNKTKSVHAHKLNLKLFKTQVEDVLEELNKIGNSIKDRKFGLN